MGRCRGRRAAARGAGNRGGRRLTRLHASPGRDDGLRESGIGQDATAVMLRPAGAGDIGACAAMIDRWIDELPWMPRMFDAAGIAAHLVAAEAHAITVADCAGRVAGFMAVETAPCGTGCITALYVATDARGAGIGARLLTQAKACHPRLCLWTFQANTGARRFYRRHGFTKARRSAGDNPEGLPDVEYLWQSAGDLA